MAPASEVSFTFLVCAQLAGFTRDSLQPTCICPTRRGPLTKAPRSVLVPPSLRAERIINSLTARGRPRRLPSASSGVPQMRSGTDRPDNGRSSSSHYRSVAGSTTIGVSSKFPRRANIEFDSFSTSVSRHRVVIAALSGARLSKFPHRTNIGPDNSSTTAGHHRLTIAALSEARYRPTDRMATTRNHRPPNVDRATMRRQSLNKRNLVIGYRRADTISTVERQVGVTREGRLPAHRRSV